VSVIEAEAVPIKVTCVVEFLGVVPHLLGYHPAESLVVVVSERGRVELTACAPLGELRRPGALAGLLSRVWARFPAGQGWFIAYGGSEVQSWEVLGRAAAWMRRRDLGGVVAVSGGRFRVDSRAGESLPMPTATVAAAQAVFQGLPAADSREQVAAGMAGPAGPGLVAARQRFQAAERALSDIPDGDWPAETLALIARESRPSFGEESEDDVLAPVVMKSLDGRQESRRVGPFVPMVRESQSVGGNSPGLSAAVPVGWESPLGPDELARLALLVAHPKARQAALLAVAAADAQRHFQLWHRVVAHTPSPYRQYPLGLLGIIAWIAGNGVVQSVCAQELERCHRSAPALAIIRQLNLSVLPPAHWEDIRKALFA
jgi:hypothetical protein